MPVSAGRPREGFSFGPYNLLVRERLLTKDGVPVELGARALDILIALISQPNEPIGKSQLIAKVWPDVTVEESSLRFHIAGLRKALGDGQDGARYITTLAGRGYCFVSPVTHLSDANPVVAAEGVFPHANLPSRLAHMVGREEDVHRISTQLMATRFVSIVGMGGVGKTTVAIAVGHHLNEAFEGAVMAVDLSVLSDPGLVATAIASMLGLSVRADDATPVLITYLRTKRMLLILDTCEHLIDAVAALASQIYVQTPDVHILATSREVLQVEGEHVYRLDTLSCPPEDSEDSLAARTFPAPRLFIERAAASGARLELSDADIAIVVRICRKLDGVALAIELAARRVEAYGLQQTEALLDQSLTLLLLGHRSATPRQKTMQAALDWSYQLLSELERAVLRRLAVFVGHFTLDAALAVATATDADQSQILAAIDSLVAKSMVATRPIGAMMRYRLLDTTRVFLLAITIDDTEATELAVRHATYYQRWLEVSGSEWPMMSTGSDRSTHFTALNNTRSALEWCFSEGGDVAIGIKLAAAAAPVFLAMSLLPECYRWSQRAIAALDDSTRGGADEMGVQAGFGVASFNLHGPSEAARAALNRSLEIAAARGSVLSQVAILRTLSLFCHRHGEFNVGLEHATRARTIAETVEEPDASALSQSAMGMSLHWIGDHRGARLELEAALQHWSSTQRTYFGVDERVFAGMGLARTLWLQGLPSQAVQKARQILDDAKLSSNPVSLAISLSWMLSILIWLRDLRNAEEHVDWLISHAQSHSLSPFLYVGRAYRGTLAICNGDPNRGIETLQDSLKSINFEILTTEFNVLLAQGLIAFRRTDDGMVLIDETIRRIETNGKLYLLPEAVRVKGHAILATPSRVDEAEGCFIQSLELSRRQGARAWELRTAIDLARLQANRGKREDGRALLQPIVERFTEGRDTHDLQTAERLLAELDQGQ